MVPDKVKLHKKSKTLELQFGAEHFNLGAEYLRVHSPSAEVKGHGPGQEVLQTGKLHVALTSLDMIGNYALKLTFDDGHNTGLYSWDYLYDLGRNESSYWQSYLDKLTSAGKTRDPEISVVKIV